MWMILDKKNDIPLKRQIYNQLKNMILDGTLQSNEKLPSTRAFANELFVSRNTILEVYNQLIAEGYLTGSHGSGTFVAEGIQQFTSKSGYFKPEQLVPKTIPINQIDFRSGIPDLALFPRKEWAKLYYNIINDLPSTGLRYNTPGGVIELRNAISQYLFRIRGINCSPENIMIVSGSTQGLSLVSKLLYQDNQNVIVENPTHPGLVHVIASAGYNIQGVTADEKGIQVNNLHPSHNLSFLYTTPSHQYPLGSH
jgi:GntR family transcriptional regulator/MocR family aminotransferase